MSSAIGSYRQVSELTKNASNNLECSWCLLLAIYVRNGCCYVLTVKKYLISIAKKKSYTNSIITKITKIFQETCGGTIFPVKGILTRQPYVFIK